MRKIEDITCCNGSIDINFYDGTRGRLFIKSCCDNCTETASFIHKEDELHFEEGNIDYVVLKLYEIPPLCNFGGTGGIFRYSWSQWVSIEFYKNWHDEKLYRGAAMIGMSMYKNNDDCFCGAESILNSISHEGLDDLYGYIKNGLFSKEIQWVALGGPAAHDGPVLTL